MTTKSGKSELRQQLRKRKELVVGATQRSLHVRPSFIFDGHEAARIEQNALHLLALSGLEQLKKLEPRFRAFESTLFAPPDSPHLDRATITKELNKRLNESIDAFLLLLSQFFLLKAAHKTIEYLIRRFR
jgi:U3 small nucleolar RNA-associated protein 10